MASKNWTARDLINKKLIQKDGGAYVKSESLVDKNVVKLKPVPFGDLALIEGLDYTVTKEIKIEIKPLTVNRAWRGQRFKTPEYKKYAEAVTLLLPNDLIVPDGLLKVYYEFGMSRNSDVDNPVKPVQDILQSKYNFNDSRIMEIHVKKVFVPKGKEYISFRFEPI